MDYITPFKTFNPHQDGKKYFLFFRDILQVINLYRCHRLTFGSMLRIKFKINVFTNEEL